MAYRHPMLSELKSLYAVAEEMGRPPDDLIAAAKALNIEPTTREGGLPVYAVGSINAIREHLTQREAK